MGHPYNDYDTGFSDVWGEMLRQAEDSLNLWLVDLARESIPYEWWDQFHGQMEEDALARKEEFLETLLKRLADARNAAPGAH